MTISSTDPQGDNSDPIAVVGASCRFPGRADSLASLWRMLMERRHTARPVPEGRWEQAELIGLSSDAAARMRYGCFLEDDVYSYDPEFFGINVQEAPWVNPEHRLLLEVMWEAIEHAGIPAQNLAGTRTGTFFGIYERDHLLRVQRPLDEVDPYGMYNGFDSVGPARLGFTLDLKGPQMVVESACSSGLVAVHTACQSLRNGEADIALAGGALLALGPEGVVGPALWGVFSPTGASRAFDADADGYVRGEGCGVVVLRRLADAVHEGDRVLAVLRGSAVNQNGRGTRLSAPSAPAQVDVFQAALQRAGVAPEDVGLVETHGPGTAVGDPIEFASVAEVYGQGRGHCALGSIKTNIGHAEPASGMAGLLKAIASVQRAVVPANLHFRRWNPQIDPSGTRLFVPTEATDWPVDGVPRLAGVCSYGISGTNAHMIVEQPPSAPRRRAHSRPLQSEAASQERSGAHIIPLSARTPAAVRALAGRISQWLSDEGAGVPLADVAHTLALRRSPLRERAAVFASGHEELASRLEGLAAESVYPGVAAGRAVSDAGPGPVWVFSGHGSQWPGMCQGLLDRDPHFTRVIDRLEPIVAAESGFSLRAQLSSPEVVAGFNKVQPVIYAIQLGLAAMWRSYGVEPAAVIGHSMGEAAAAVAAGALSMEDGARVICRRSRLILRAAGLGLMASVSLGREDVEQLLADDGVEGVETAVVASPHNTVIGGDAQKIRDLAQEWDERGIGAHVVEVEVASHTAHMDPVLPDIVAELADVTGQGPQVPFYSTVTDDPREQVAFDADYWGHNLRRQVRFADAVRAAAEDGHRVFVEVNAHSLLAGAVQATLTAHGHADTAVVSSLLRDTDDVSAFHTNVAALHCAGHPLDLEVRYRDGALVDVPATTWERRRYAVEPSSVRHAPRSNPLLGAHTVDPADESRHLWQARVGTPTIPWLADHRVDNIAVLPGAAMCEMAVAAAADLFDVAPGLLRVTDVELERLLPLMDDGALLTCAAEQTAPGRSQWRLTSTDAEGATVRCAQAQLHMVSEEDQGPQDCDLQQLLGQFPHAVDPQEFYRKFDESFRVQHGDAFRGMRTVYVGGTDPHADREHCLLGHLEVPNGGRSGATALISHPVMLDSCLQVFAAACFRAGLTEGNVLPRRIGELRLHAKLPLSGYCLVTLEEVAEDHYRANLRLWDEDGALAAEVLDAEMQVLPQESDAERFTHRLFQAVWETAERPELEEASGTWVLLAETGQHERAAALRDTLTMNGAEVHVCELSPDGLLPNVYALQAQAVVYLPSAASNGTAPGCAAHRNVSRLLALAQQLNAPEQEQAPRLWVLTEQAQHVAAAERPNLEQSGPRGLMRVLSYEHPALHPSVLDVAPETLTEDIACELLSCPQTEDEVAYRRGERYLARLRNAPMEDEDRKQRVVDWSRDQVGLHYRQEGDLDSFELAAEPDPSPPGPGEVKVKLTAHSINFLNVLQAMGVFKDFRVEGEDDNTIACDGAGVVTGVGDGVQSPKVGDRVVVLYLADASSSFAIVRADCAALVPEGMSLNEAAGLPTGYVTAWYALRHRAQLRPGQTVLIHSASGGTGLAALNVAQFCGAQVLATAGTEKKRQYLRSLGVEHVLDSRSLDFADQVRRITGGRGVDVVLNSLTGRAQAASLDLVARQGWFLEIGKKDIYADNRLGLLPFRRHIIFASIDMQLMMKTDPQAIAECLQQMMPLFADGTLPPLPVSAHSVSDASSAYHTMASAQHIGKLVLTWPDESTESLPVQPDDATLARSSGSYVISGGLGGLGLLVARRLVARGAGTVVLTSRSAPSTHAQSVIDELRGMGSRVTVVSGDIAQPGVAKQVVSTATSTGHPLCGVVHAAAVVEDAVAANITSSLLEKVWRPKVTGAWALHQAVQDSGAGLDWWVNFSSATSLLGNPGQGAYAAANAWLDEFTSWQRSQDLPAICINWGPWAEVGRGASMEERGFTMIQPEEGIDALEQIMAHDRAQTAYTPPEVSNWLGSYPDTARLGFFSALTAEGASTDRNGASGEVLQELKELEGSERHNRLLDLITENVCAVLRIDAERIDPNTSLVSLGLDSLMAIALRNRIHGELSFTIPTTVLWTKPTPKALTDYVLEHLFISEEV